MIQKSNQGIPMGDFYALQNFLCPKVMAGIGCIRRQKLSEIAVKGVATDMSAKFAKQLGLPAKVNANSGMIEAELQKSDC